MTEQVENAAVPGASAVEIKKLAEAKAAEIKAAATAVTTALIATNPSLGLKQVVFHFKKEKIRNNEGEVIGEGTKRDSIEMDLPVPSVVSILNAGGKALALLEEAVLDTIYTRARELFSEDTGRVLDAANFPYDKLDWDTIANLPVSEKRGGGIAKETWDNFYDDYVEVMVAVTGREKARITKAADIFKARLQPVRSRKEVITALRGFLQTWFEATANKEEFVDVYKFLIGKCEVFLKEDDAALLEAL